MVKSRASKKLRVDENDNLKQKQNNFQTKLSLKTHRKRLKRGLKLYEERIKKAGLDAGESSSAAPSKLIAGLTDIKNKLARLDSRIELQVPDSKNFNRESAVSPRITSSGQSPVDLSDTTSTIDSSSVVNSLPKKRKKNNNYPTEWCGLRSSDITLGTNADGELLPLHYTTSELTEMYGTKTKPSIAPQNKKGGQCAFQAYCNLLWSIDSIGQKSAFAHVQPIRERMAKAVDEINTASLTGQLDALNPYLEPGDLQLIQFSVHALRSMKQIEKGVGIHRFSVMRKSHKNGGHLLCADWVLRQKKGYFIIYGNRHVEKKDVEKKGENDKKYAEGYHFLAVNIEKKLIIDNTSLTPFLRLCAEAFVARLPTVIEVLRLEKKFNGEEMWKVDF